MAKNVGWEAKSNHDGSYTVTVNGKQYYCADTHEFLHFLEDIGERWGIVKFEKDERREFSTGAVRDKADGKGRYDLLPWGAIHALAQHCERGAIHYGERNVDKGIPQHSLIDSGIRHLSLYIQGDAEAHHLVAALWNIAWAVEQEIKRPEMVDLPERGEHSGIAF